MSKLRFSFRLLRLFLVFALLGPIIFPASVSAQTTATSTTTSTDASSITSAVAAQKAQLQSALDQLNAEISQQQSIITNAQDQQESLSRDVAILDAQIKSAQLTIQADNLQIEQLNAGIASKQGTVDQLNQQIQAEEASLADLLRQQAKLDSTSLVEVMLSDQTLSSYFSDLDTFASIKSALADSYNEITLDASTTQSEENDLIGQKTEESQILQVQQLQQQRLQQEEDQKNQIIAQSKGVESEYQKMLAANQKSAATIRAELFTLNGSSAISFATALQYADEVSQKLGVRPAFLLGIIAEESDLGANIGTGNWKVDMKAPRDTVPFLAICQSLGLNPDLMPVSKKPWYGYGGAMGPAQFIPSTWVLYESKITALTGDNPPNPWDPKDAFFAAGILLEENGAAVNGQPAGAAAERLAALRYLAGWNNATDSAYAFYGDDVMSLAANYQQQIDILNN